MKALLLAALGAGLLAYPIFTRSAPQSTRAPASSAPQSHDAAPPAPPRPDERARWFSIADANRDGKLSRDEYLALRLNAVDARWVRNYRSDRVTERTPVIEAGFSAMDLNGDGFISATEFANAGLTARPGMRAMPNGADNEFWDGDPEYVSLTYYLTATPIDTTRIQGRKVYDFQGREAGTIARIVRTNDAETYYAMIALPQQAQRYQSGQQAQAEMAAVPLRDVLLYRRGSSLLLGARASEYLARGGENIATFEIVTRLHRR